MPRNLASARGCSAGTQRTNQYYSGFRAEVVGIGLHLREDVYLGLYQSLLFIFIFDFVIVTLRVGKYVAVVIDV